MQSEHFVDQSAAGTNPYYSDGWLVPRHGESAVRTIEILPNLNLQLLRLRM
jgi:hypothetical protein